MVALGANQKIIKEAVIYSMGNSDSRVPILYNNYQNAN
jgi:hypothetical protein